MEKILYESHFDTPIGRMISIFDDQFLYLLEFEERKNLSAEIKRLKCQILPGQTAVSKQIEEEIRAYFAGEKAVFTTALFIQGTDFQKAVWTAVSEVKSGETATYQSIAHKIGNAKASLAVGAANGVNQFAIVIPCHRLLRSNGALAGYAGGLWRKAWLLEHEQKMKNNTKN